MNPMRKHHAPNFKRILARMPLGLIALYLLASGLDVTLAHSLAESNRAGLVVVHGNGQVSKPCVLFTESQITGYDLLTRSNLDLSVDASNPTGVAVCRLDREGCTYPGQTCFCQCQGSPCIYWSFWRLNAGVWKYSNLGASSTVIHNGDVDGWVWGAGNFSSATAPPSVIFEQVCPLPTPTQTASATSAPLTPTPIPPTNTPLPSSTVRLLSTNTPLASRNATLTSTRLPLAARAASPIFSPTSAPLPSSTLLAFILGTPPATLDLNRAAATETIPASSSESDSANNIGFGAPRIALLAVTGCALVAGGLLVLGLALGAIRHSRF